MAANHHIGAHFVGGLVGSLSHYAAKLRPAIQHGEDRAQWMPTGSQGTSRGVDNGAT